jgi:hypothetical protein
VLSPGHNFTAFDTLANDAFVCYMYGYERPARPEELAA